MSMQGASGKEPDLTWESPKMNRGSHRVAAPLLSQDFCMFCVIRMIVNSAGRTAAIPIITISFPFVISSDVMVRPGPIFTKKASSGLAPARAPCFHNSIK